MKSKFSRLDQTKNVTFCSRDNEHLMIRIIIIIIIIIIVIIIINR